MSSFTPLVTREYTFENDTISVSFSRLKVKHMLVLAPLITRIEERIQMLTSEAEEADSSANVLSLVEILEKCGGVVKDCVKGFTGLNDADGNALSIETICEEPYFTKLFMEILFDIMRDSSLGSRAGEAGN